MMIKDPESVPAGMKIKQNNSLASLDGHKLEEALIAAAKRSRQNSVSNTPS